MLPALNLQHSNLRRSHLGWLLLWLAPSACSHDWADNAPQASGGSTGGGGESYFIDETGGSGAAGNTGNVGGAGGGAPQACDGGQTSCTDTCVDTQSDPQHCGGCGIACGSSQLCNAGRCSCVDGATQDIGALVPQVVPGSTAGAADVFPASCIADGAGDAVFRFRAPAAGTYIFETGGASFDAAIALIDGDNCKELDCHDDPSSWMSRASAVLLADQELYVVVSGVGAATGDFTLGVRQPPACEPLDLGSAVPRTVSGNTAGRTDAVAPVCGAAGSSDAAYTFTAPTEGIYSFDTVGSSFDTVIEVLDGSCVGAPLGCDDEQGDGRARVFASLTTGQTVIVVIDGRSGASGPYSLNVESSDGNCSVTVLDSMVPQTVTGTTTGAHAEVSAPCAPSFGPEVVHMFTAPMDGRYTMDTLGSSFDTVLSVHDGSCTAMALACNDDIDVDTNRRSRLTVDLVAGQTVAIVVNGYRDWNGDYQLNISL